eukprot:TRINITY_DN249_c0_g1_i1.p1 TRINITY_DN249_c0_g1~~TRINITY_DN249_c0_g1_i1.p1  ORF type:complete len:99 (-),score=13.61 TRINITY_DN249_c0_g1_i1:284-580(-)
MRERLSKLTVLNLSENLNLDDCAVQELCVGNVLDLEMLNLMGTAHTQLGLEIISTSFPNLQYLITFQGKKDFLLRFRERKKDCKVYVESVPGGIWIRL